MFGKKLIVIAAAVALAVHSVAAAPEAAHIKVHIAPQQHAQKQHAAHHHKQSPHAHAAAHHKHAPKHAQKHAKHAAHATKTHHTKEDLEIELEIQTVEDAATSGSGHEWVDSSSGSGETHEWEGSSSNATETSSGSTYVDDEDDSESADSTENTGVTDDTHNWDGEDDGETGGEGEATGDDTIEIDICVGDGVSPMSVEGVEGVFCVTGQACVAEIQGACPDAQDGLEYGAYCDRVQTGVLGCKPKTKEMYDAEHHEDSPADLCTGEGESPMSVEGVEGVFCVTGQACVADIDGACPDSQEGLEYGSYCGKVVTGVMGCKPKTEEQWLGGLKATGSRLHKKHQAHAKHHAHKKPEHKKAEHKHHAEHKTHAYKPAHVKIVHKSH